MDAGSNGIIFDNLDDP